MHPTESSERSAATRHAPLRARCTKSRTAGLPARTYASAASSTRPLLPQAKAFANLRVCASSPPSLNRTAVATQPSSVETSSRSAACHLRPSIASARAKAKTCTDSGAWFSITGAITQGESAGLDAHIDDVAGNVEIELGCANDGCHAICHRA